ncbi:MAG: hypothetical protein A2939_03090 [Parcubacteria group bacterium RIFCSPLOWO2_01_FULL_48_18]|nr:MAG: hypothetical protein A2939_03090 [Parcubacteria group bacterium RIFCSPLOWO2_01_FULL_48_18]OHB23272.1 MAG: hypothetical protein A3J67_04235 [Parcubacteria group bacterium RIFCSPHIGHO2_02_FULL_48_10b]
MDEEIKKFFEDLSTDPAPHADLVSVKTDHGSASAAVMQGTDDDENNEDEEKEGVFGDDELRGDEGQLTIDVYQKPNEIIIQSTIAGVAPEDLEVSVTDEMVTIRGRREKSESVETRDYLYQELYWGRFSRSVILPQDVDSEQATAELKNGILTVRLPKIKKQKTKKLKVKTPA